MMVNVNDIPCMIRSQHVIGNRYLMLRIPAKFSFVHWVIAARFTEISFHDLCIVFRVDCSRIHRIFGCSISAELSRADSLLWRSDTV